MFVGSQVISILIFVALAIVVAGYICWFFYRHFKPETDEPQKFANDAIAHKQ